MDRNLVSHRSVSEGLVEPRAGAIAAGAVEVPSLRTADSDTYDLGDGRLQTKTFTAPINYQSGSGWQPINPTLVGQAGGGWSNTAGPYTVALPAALSSPVSVSSAAGSVSLQLVGASAAGMASSQTVTYPAALPGDDVSYSTGNYFVKEDVTLASAASTSSLSYAVSASAGLTPSAFLGGVLFSAGSGAAAVGLSRPFATDAAGNVGAVTLGLTPTAGGWTVTMKVDPTWLASAARAFPVVIDPTVVTLSGSGESDCSISAAAQTTNECPAGAGMTVGHTSAGAQRGLVRFDVSSIPSTATVLSADLALSSTSSQTGATTVGVYPSTTAWTASQTSWLTASSGVQWTTAGGDYSSTAADSQSVPATPGTVNFYPSHLVAQWVDGAVANDGMELVAANEGTLNTLMSFASGTNTNSALWPSLTVTYGRFPVGDASYFSQSSHTLNDRSTMKINNADGSMLIDARDVAVSGDGTPADLDRVFNSGTTGVRQFGSGWRLSGGPDVHLDALGGGDFDYVDPSGTVYGFVHNPAGGYFPTPGLNAQLQPSGSGYTVTYNSSQEQLSFAQEGCTGSCSYVETSDQTRNGANTALTFQYSGRQLASITDAQGRVFTVAYNAAGYIKTITDANISPTRTWQYGYTGSDLTSYIDPDNNETDYSYTSDRVSQITDPANQSGNRPTVKIVYSSLTGPVQQINYVTGSSSYEFDYATGTGAGSTCPRTTSPYTSIVATYLAVTDVNDPQGGTTTYCGNVNTQVISTYDGVGDHRSSTYTANLNPASSTDAMATSSVFNYAYDGNNNLTSITEPASVSGGHSATTSLNYPTTGSNGSQYEPMRGYNSSGECSSQTYDTYGNVSATYSGQSGTTCSSGSSSLSHTQKSYNPQSGAANSTAPAGTISTTTNGLGGVTHYSYNAHGDLQAVAQPGATLSSGTCTASTLCTSYVVDGDARRVSSTDGNGVTTTYTRDPMDRVTQIQTGTGTCNPSAGTCVKYKYDAEGNLTSRTDVTGATSFAYNQSNELTKQTNPDSGVIKQGFDGAGNLTSSSYTPSGGSADAVTYGYNAAQELTSVHDTTGTITIAEDADGRRHSVTYPNGEVITYGYSNAGKITSITPSGSISGLPTLGYSYSTGTGTGTQDTDLLQTSTSNISGSNITSTYGYNLSAQLLTVTPTSGTATTLGPDKDGNLTTSSGFTTGCNSYNTADEIAASSPTYSGSTCTGTSTPWAEDADGNVLNNASGGFVMTYNSLGQTATAQHPGNPVVTYSYSDIGNTLRSSASVTGGGTITYVNTPQGLTSRTVTGTFAGGTAYDGTTDYTRDPSGQLLNEHGGPAGTNYYESDYQGSTVALAGSSAVTATYTYTPYGNSVSATGTAASDNPFRYTGGYLDNLEGDGFYHLGARYYTRGGWFTQPDPTQQEADLYLYTGGNPANYTDPTGDSLLADLVGIGTGIAVGLALIPLGLTGLGAVAGVFLGADLTGAAYSITEDATTGSPV